MFSQQFDNFPADSLIAVSPVDFGNKIETESLFPRRQMEIIRIKFTRIIQMNPDSSSKRLSASPDWIN